MKRVALIAAGGTIAMGARHPFDWVEYGDSGIVHDAAALAARFGDVLAGVEFVPVPFRALGSVAIGWDDWCDLLVTLERVADETDDLDGIIVTHGTATLEETAFFLDLTWQHDLPIVLVGAQRPPDTHGSDAVPNLRAAAAVAASAEARGMGVLVVMNGEIFSPVDVTKSANFRLEAFTASGGPLGSVEPDGRVRFIRAVVRRRRGRFAPRRPPPRVDMLLSHAGGDGVAVEAFVAAGARGIVAMALPPGRVAAGERRPLVEAAARGVVVVLASRAIRDGIPIQTYNVRDGIVTAGDLAAHKARVLLMLALGEGLDGGAIQDLLSATGRAARLYTECVVR